MTSVALRQFYMVSQIYIRRAGGRSNTGLAWLQTQTTNIADAHYLPSVVMIEIDWYDKLFCVQRSPPVEAPAVGDTCCRLYLGHPSRQPDGVVVGDMGCHSRPLGTLGVQLSGIWAVVPIGRDRRSSRRRSRRTGRTKRRCSGRGPNRTAPT